MANGTYKLSEQPGYNRQLAMAIGEVRDIAEAARESIKPLIPDGPITITETTDGMVIGSTGGSGTMSTIYPSTF